MYYLNPNLGLNTVTIWPQLLYLLVWHANGIGAGAHSMA